MTQLYNISKMKKLILLLSLFVVATLTMGQTKVTEVTPDSYISGSSYQYIFGTTADTLTNADTLSWTIRVKGNVTQDFNIQLYSDYVSGTAGGTLVLSHSIDGITYTSVTGDTITISSVTADALDAEVISKDNFLYPYMKLDFLQTGATAVTIPRVYIYTKEN